MTTDSSSAVAETVEENFDHELPLWARQAWARTVQLVNEFGPDVIVLTARKMPRMCDGLQPHFGPHPLVITDLAVPFSAEYLNNARVAIIDDVVNFGSTLGRINKMVERYSPTNVKVFSLATKAEGKGLANGRQISLGHAVALEGAIYDSYIRTVPALISHVCKPYDLSFPILRANYSAPYHSSADIVAQLKNDFGEQTVEIIPSPYLNSPVRRASIIFSCHDIAPHQKLRFYFNDVTRTCCVVPMAIRNVIENSRTQIKTKWVELLEAELKASLSNSKGDPQELLAAGIVDGYAAVSVFTTSLDWFWSQGLSKRLNRYLQFLGFPFSLEDARYVFGPKINRIVMRVCGEIADSPRDNYVAPNKPGSAACPSPFQERFPVNRLLSNAATLIRKNGVPLNGCSLDSYGYVFNILQALSELVGANDPTQYDVEWPYTKQEALENPYLRLRIGPTFSDLLTLCGSLYKVLFGSDPEFNDLAHKLSISLDALVDQGAVVPTFAVYDDKVFRIYRRGEAPGQDTCDAVLVAFSTYDKALSITRLAKVLATLSHTKKPHALLNSSARARGLVGSAPKTVLGAEPDNLAGYLRNTGQIKSI